MNTSEKLHSASVLALGALAIVASVAGWTAATIICAAATCWLAWRGRAADAESVVIVEAELADD